MRTARMGWGVGFVLWLVAALSPSAAPHPSTNDNRPDQPRSAEIAPTPTAAKQQPVESPFYKQPCSGGPNDRESDLCAQWQAADAARDSANWAMLAALAAIGGAIGLVVQILLTRKAVGIAMDDRRPSVYADAVKFWTEGNTVKAEIGIKNFGQTEALKVVFDAGIGFSPYPLLDHPPPLADGTDPHPTLQPGAPMYHYLEKGDLDAARIEQIKAGTLAFLVYGRVRYSDRYGRSYSDRFDYFTTGKDFESRALRIAGPWKAEEEKDGDEEAKHDG